MTFSLLLSKLLFWCRTLKGSVIAFLLTLILGLLSMGLLGMVLYYPVAPVLRLRFPPPEAWHGDWVWPAMILAGMAWSFGFLLAGGLNHRLEARLPTTPRRWIYLGVLWAWDLAVWFLILSFPPN